MKLVLILAACCAVSLARDSLTVDPNSGGGGGSKGPDLSGTDLQAVYCEAKKKECAGSDLETAKFAPTARQCQIRCTYNLQCLDVFYSADRVCHLRAKRCSSSELKSSSGNDYYRLKKGESCPADRPQYKEGDVKFSNTFCMLKDKTCKGHDLYAKPQNIKPFQKCLEKCARIASCAMVDFTNNKCSPKSHSCSDDELVDSPGSVNALRLVDGVPACDPSRQLECGDNSHASGTECVCNDGWVEKNGKCVKGEPEPTQPPAPTCGANSHAVGQNCECNSGYEKVGDQCLTQCGANSARVGQNCECSSGYEKVGDQCLTQCTNGQRSGSTCNCNAGFAMKGGSCQRSGYSLSGSSLYGVCKDRGQHEYCEIVGDCNAGVHIIRNVPLAGLDGCKRACDDECGCEAFRLHTPDNNCFLVSTPCSTMDHTIGTWRFHVKAKAGQTCEQAKYGCRDQQVEYCRRPGDCAGFNIRHVPTGHDNCQQLCTNECACKAYFHDGGLGCWLKSIACTKRTHAVTAYGYYIKMAKGEDCDWAIEGRCRDVKTKYCFRNGDCAGHNIRAEALGLNDCKRACDRECSCKAFYHDRGLGCVLKSIGCTKLTHASPATEYYVKIGADENCPSEFGREVPSYQ